jgi:hypothetical protein
MKRKLAGVLAGTAVLGTLAFANVASAQDTLVVQPATSDSTVVIDSAAPGTQVIVEPAGTLALAPTSPSFESPIRYGFAAARQPGSVPSPYGDLPSSGHIGDEFYYKQFGGVSPP